MEVIVWGELRSRLQACVLSYEWLLSNLGRKHNFRRGDLSFIFKDTNCESVIYKQCQTILFTVLHKTIRCCMAFPYWDVSLNELTHLNPSSSVPSFPLVTHTRRELVWNSGSSGLYLDIILFLEHSLHLGLRNRQPSAYFAPPRQADHQARWTSWALPVLGADVSLCSQSEQLGNTVSF